MKTIDVKYHNSNTTLYIENNLLDFIDKIIDPNKKYFILTDEVVYNLYADKLNLDNAYFQILTPGEDVKNIHIANEIIASMLELNINKGDILINFGGGVISDLGGFIASIYKRGIIYYNIPTTLLAQVDACIGGKTAIDFSYSGKVYKNQVGSIYHPSLIFVDPNLLKTLKEEDYYSGMGEVIKYGLCFDEGLFNSLSADFNLEEVVYKCLLIKAKITEEDEYERNIRLALNYGHTIGHAVEAITNFQVPHGICVLYGMLIETEDKEIKSKLKNLIDKLNIKFNFNIKNDSLQNYINQDKKIVHDQLRLPILKKIGEVEIINVKIDEFLKRLK